MSYLVTARRIVVGMFVLALLAAGIGPGVGRPACALPEPGAEQAGATIPYAGRLSDETSQPVADGAYDFTFTLYDAAAGGEPLWSEVQRGVAVAKGEFLASLGTVEPLPATVRNGPDRWLAVSVRGPGEAEFTALAPRQRLDALTVAAPASPLAAPPCPHDHLGEWWSGNPGTGNNGLRVESTRTDSNGITGVAHNGPNAVGVFGWTTQGVGVQGSSDSNTGVKGTSNSGPGVRGTSGDATGVWGHSTNGYGVFAHSDNNHSIYVDGAGNSALYISSAGASGVYVLSAASAGVGVYSAGMMGRWVHSAARDGILVDTAGWDGIHVTGPVGGVYYGSGTRGDEDFAVLNTGEVRSKVGFGTPARDFAVLIEVEGARSQYEAGDVLVASDTRGGAVALAATPYAPAVVGVYSASPGFVGGQPVTGDQQADGIPVAILGIVQCKVSAENGPVRPGDLLVTSSTPGHAMRADDPARGTVLGKALGVLESGTGLVEILVTLQ